MDNATPLKKAKKPVNKFFLIANIVLLFIVVVIGSYYLTIYKPSTTKPKADGNFGCNDTGGNYFEQDGDCIKIKAGITAFNAQRYSCPDNACPQSSCGQNRQTFNNVTEICLENNCGTEQIDAYSPIGDGICWIVRCSGQVCGSPTEPPSQPTNTPIPTLTSGSTATPTPTSIPTATPTSTPTATPTSTPTATPTITPTGTIVPSATPTVTPTGTPGPTATNTPGPTLTPIPVLCGTKDCDDKTNPCRSGYNCVQAHDGSNYCTSPDFANACKANPSYNSCCTAPGAPTATPTEIILAKTSPTKVPVPVSGEQAWLMFIIPALIIIGSLILL